MAQPTILRLNRSMTAARWRHDGAHAMSTHQPLDPAAAHATSLVLQGDVNTRAAIASVVVLMDLLDRTQEFAISRRSSALRPRSPSVVASRRDLQHAAHELHRIAVAVVLDEAKAHGRVPEKIAIDFFKMSFSMRSRSFSRRSRAISAAWSADGSAACVGG